MQEHAAPAQLRLEALTKMQVDALWQRDIRVYRTDRLAREHASLADAYLSRLKQVTGRFLGLRSAAVAVQVIGLGLALSGVGLLINRGQLTLANLAVLVAGAAFLSGIIGTFIYYLRELWESLACAQTLFDFLAKRFEADAVAATYEPADQAPPGLAAIRIVDIGYMYPNNQKPALSGVTCAFSPAMSASVGTNGAGKSTLVKLLAGQAPSEILREGQAGWISPMRIFDQHQQRAGLGPVRHQLGQPV